MNRKLRLIAALMVLGPVLWWLAAGANRGWTKTSVPKKIVDPVTGIEGIMYESHFVPGLDVLGLAVLGAGALAGMSLVFRSKPIDSHAQLN